MSLNNVNFTSNGRAVELADCNSSNGTPTINITGGTITGRPGVYAGSANDKISSVTIQGATLDGKGGNGIYVYSNANATLTNTTIRNCSYGIYVYAGASQQDAYATISGCIITNSVQHMAYLYSGDKGQKANLTINGGNAVTSAAGADIVCGAANSTRANVNLTVKTPKQDNNPWLISSQYNNSKTILGDSANMDAQCIKAYDPHCHIYTDNTSTTERIALSNHNPSWSITSNSAKGTITAYCTVDGCKFHDPMTLTATVEKSHIYDGTAVSAAVTGADAMTTAGLTVTTEYYKGDTKLSAAPSDFGGYTAKVRVTGGDQSGTLELPFSIVAPIEGISGLVYNRTAQNLVKPVALSDEIKIYYKLSTESAYSTTIPMGTNAGEYTVQYYMTDSSGSAIYGTKDKPYTLDVTIAKATPKLTIDTLTHEYNGKVFEPTVTADTDEVTEITVTCCDMQGKGVGPRNAGAYTVEATSLETTNYKSATTGGSLKITPKEVGVTWSDLELVYNGSYQGPTATINQQDLVEGDRTLSLAVTEKQAAGTYTAQAYVQNNDNYRISTETWQQEFVIKPKPVTIVWGENDFTYTGSSQAPTAAVQAGDLIGSDTTSVTVTGQQRDASDTPYTATAALGNSNYTPANPTKEFTIAKFTPTLSDVKASIAANTKDIAKVTVTGSWNAPSALSSLPGTLEPKEGQSLTWGENGLNYITCVFTPNDTKNIASVEVENVPVQLVDTVKPEVTYTLNGTDWNDTQYLNTDAQVTITVTDAVSGFKSGEYAVTWEDEPVSASDWNPIPENGQVTVDVPAKHGKILHIKLHAKDKAGNGAGEWSSTPCVFITQPPVIDLDANKTYYVTTKFSVSGLEITSVTRKNSTNGVTDPIGTTASDNFLLPGNTNTTYTITAEDVAGNVTTVTVTMKPIQSIMDPLKGVMVDNVTADNEQTVRERIPLVTNLMSTPDIPTNEYNSLYNVLSGQLEPLLERISQVSRLYNEVLKYASITEETVTKQDAQKITDGLDAISAAENFAGNLTNDQKTKIAEIKQNLRAAQDLLKQVSSLEAEINALPNSVEPDDVDAVTRVRDVRSARASLSDHAQELIDGMCNAKLDALWAQATTYKIIKGDGKVWMRSEGDYEVVANGPYDWFTQLLIDGETVEPDSYTAASGSTVVTLPKAYMDDLKDGKHTVVFVYENDGPLGQAEGSFTVQTPASGSPRTGDENNMLPYGIAIVAALAALAVLFVPKKRKKQ